MGFARSKRQEREARLRAALNDKPVCTRSQATAGTDPSKKECRFIGRFLLTLPPEIPDERVKEPLSA